MPARRLRYRAAVLTKAGTTSVEQTLARDPAADEVRVRLEGSGICASNLPVWEGRDWFRYPLEPGAPGHEGWGIVDAIGDGVDSVAVGDRVALMSHHAYAEYDIAPAAAVRQLPHELDGKPFPGEPLGCVMNIFCRAGIRSGHTVAVVGAGFLGVLLTRLASEAGARVLVTSRRPYALELAREAGAMATCSADSYEQARPEVLRLTEGRGFDRVIEAAGLQVTLDLATQLTRERGRLIIAGFHQDGPRRVDMQLWNWRGLDVINAHERDPARYAEGIGRAAAAVVDGRLDPYPLFTHEVALDELDTAFELMQRRPPGFMKALVRV
ncbi:zinc-binding dehydrogenase [soil metagenome]